VNHWSIDIVRQHGFDLWCWVCLGAAVMLVAYALTRRLWTAAAGWLATIIIFGVVGGTIGILAVPPLHSAFIGLGWTFMVLCVLAVAFYLNLVPQLGRARTATLLILRIAALALLVPMLFEPVLKYQSRPPPQRPLIFMIDASGSMSFPDLPNGPTRIQSVWQTLQPQLTRIYENFVPQFFTFSTGSQALKKPDDLPTVVADGKATDLAGAVRGAAAASPRQDAVVMLISDGVDNVSPNVVEAIRSAARRVCTITVGSEQAEPARLPNVAVQSVAAEDDVVVAHENKIVATITSTALPNRIVDVKMAEIDSAAKPISAVQIKQLVLQPTAAGQKVELAYNPAAAGLHKLAVWIDPIPGERSTADNRQEFQVLALDPRIKVLYIEGRLRPEYKYLHRLLQHDPNIEESALLRLQGNTFAAASQAGQKLRDLPSTLEQWKQFDVVILGDLPSSFLSAGQQQALEQAVSGGMGLLMIGGENNFAAGGYRDSLLEKILPVFVGNSADAQDKDQFWPQLTPDGQGHPILEDLTDCFAAPGGQAPARPLAPLRGNVAVGAAKTGAQVLLIHPGKTGPDGQAQIVLAAQRYGKGRSAAFTADTTYLWHLATADQQNDPYTQFWAQLVRWLAGADVRNRQNTAGLIGLIDQSVYPFGQAVRVRALVRDAHGQATSFAQVSMKLQSSNGAPPVPFSLAPRSDRIGMYQQLLPDPSQNLDALPAGDYTIDLLAIKDGKELGRAELKFSVIPPADEFLKIAANPPLMREIAQATGGFSNSLDGLPAMLDQLIRSDASSQRPQEQALPLTNTVRALIAAVRSPPQWPKKYDLPMQAVLVAALLMTEWILRRKWQLQ